MNLMNQKKNSTVIYNLIKYMISSKVTDISLGSLEGKSTFLDKSPKKHCQGTDAVCTRYLLICCYPLVHL